LSEGDRTVELIAHPLLLPLIVPLVGGFVCLVLPRAAERACGWWAVLVSAVSAGLIWVVFTGGDARLDAGAWLSLRVDALSAFVLIATAAFGVLIALYSVGYMRGREHQRAYFSCLLWTLSAAFGALLANDLLVFLVCWGFLALTLYVMIGIAGPGAADAARKSLMIVGGTDALLMLGAILMWSLSGTTRMDIAPITLDSAVAQVAFVCFVAAAFAKAGAVPLHTWVPDCGERADAPVSAFLPASLDKLLGIYLLVRVCRDMFELTAGVLAVLMLLGAVTILAAVMMALVQHDLKRLLAYHAVSQVGYMVLGIASGTAVGLAGGLFHMLNHAIYKCALFLCAGSVEQAAGTTDLDRLGGLSRTMPLTFATCTIAALAISGIPPLNGFASKWMVYQGIIDAAATAGPVWIVCLVAAMLGSALTLASFVKVLHAAFLCKPSPDVAARRVVEAGGPMLIPMLLLASACIAFGVFAAALPLRLLILPAVPAEIAGVWWSGTATALLLGAIGAGGLVYFLTMRRGRLRRVETYVGGERLDEVYVRGEAPGAGRHIEVTGVDFFDTIEQLPGLRRLYALARQRAFDVYAGGANVVAYAVTVLRGAHSGFLPTYLLWFLAGLLGLVYAFTRNGVP
jgi:formate hydrogenlyase subunit 3/multisubunit Na+/H+ antiporter MnhD subunit